MRSTKMDAVALEEAMWVEDSDRISAFLDVRPRLEDLGDDGSDELGFRKLLEQPETLSPSLSHRLGF